MTRTFLHPLYSFIKCPYCKGELEFDRFVSVKRPIEKASIYCTRCQSEFRIDNFVPNILPAKFINVIENIENYYGEKRFKVGMSGIRKAYAWLAETAKISYEKIEKKDAFGRALAIALEACKQHGLDEKDTQEIIGILGSHFMSRGYKFHVADQLYASDEAISYEKYEDILLRKVVQYFLSKAKPVTIIELGSGVGRVLHQYGCCTSSRKDACRPYRRVSPSMYLHNSLGTKGSIEAIIGIDFETAMAQRAMRWLKGSKIFDLVSQKGQIIQILGSIRHCNLSFKGSRFEKTSKIACILFQTLGNQISRELQIDLLRKAWEFVSPNGVVFVSVFNSAAFETQGRPYYSSIKGSVGRAIYWKDNVFLSSRGVYSKWFTVKEVEKLFKEAGIENYPTVLNGNTLKSFPQYDRYIDSNIQKVVKERGIIGIAGLPKAKDVLIPRS